ncbi:hypothetical protein GLYMA_17G067850v4 [Glycine max]|nr:hypothetical protein GLYMA_17G067850v4 [Glycine max]KAH1117168.1 hypothetical protein GYH30_046483 [Glycine max]
MMKVVNLCLVLFKLLRLDKACVAWKQDFGHISKSLSVALSSKFQAHDIFFFFFKDQKGSI